MDGIVGEVGAADDTAERFDLIVIGMGSGAEVWHAIFGSPQVASVGIVEREARHRGVNHVVASYEYDQTAFGSSIEDHDGFVKVLVDPDTGEILGCHILGADASTLIQGVANLVRSHLTVDVMRRAIFVHPALPEVVQAAFAELPASVGGGI